jgi:hypothetical protein
VSLIQLRCNCISHVVTYVIVYICITLNRLFSIFIIQKIYSGRMCLFTEYSCWYKESFIVPGAVSWKECHLLVSHMHGSCILVGVVGGLQKLYVCGRTCVAQSHHLLRNVPAACTCHMPCAAGLGHDIWLSTRWPPCFKPLVVDFAHCILYGSLEHFCPPLVLCTHPPCTV